MPTYAIGDIQGCLLEFKALLEAIQFDAYTDQLWLLGDLINRGPHSLEVLRFIRDLPLAPKIVLGNHDLHLLTIAYGIIPLKSKDNLSQLLGAPDSIDLCNWLRQQSLLHYDSQLGYVMVHAGIWPFWTLEEARENALLIESGLKSSDPASFLRQLYQDIAYPHSDPLLNTAFIANVFTRMRFCSRDGTLDFYNKHFVSSEEGYQPWFKLPHLLPENLKVIFGHWSSLKGNTHTKNRYALDTGCVWGNGLTALRLEDGQFFRVSSENPNLFKEPLHFK